MPEHTIAHRIRAKYPGTYDDLSDSDIESKVTEKYPGVYDDLPRTEQPSLISRATQGVSDLFEKATTSIPALEQAKEAIGNIPTMAGGQSGLIKPIFQSLFPTTPLDVGLTAIPGIAGQAAKGVRALRGAAKVADVATDVAKPVAQAAKSIPLGQPRVIKETGKFFRQLPEAEQAAVMANRERFVNDLSAVGIKPTTTLLHRFDKLSTTYSRAQKNVLDLSELAVGGRKKRIGIEGKTIEGKGFQEWNEFSRNLGKQLGNAQRLIKSGKIKSEETLLNAVEKALDEAGSAAGQLVTRIATAGAGAAAGGAVGDTPEERFRNAAIGGVAGAVAPGAIKGVGRAAKGLKPQNLEDYVYFALLSNPITAAKANLGSIGAVFVKGTELITEGAATLNPKLIAQGGKALKELLPGSESMRIYFRSLKNPAVAQKIVGETGKVPGTGLTGKTIGRVFSAGDAAAVNALKKAGISVDEARTLTLAGDPTSKLGKATMKGLETVKREGGALGRAAVPLVSPFPRVGIQALERGIERTPLGLLRSDVPLAKRVAQVGTGVAAEEAGRNLQGKIPPWAVPLVGAATGPAVLPFAIGHALSLAQQGGGGQSRAITGAVSENLPIGGEAVRSFIDPASILRRLVPGAVGAVARGTDPAFGRETGGKALKESGIPEPIASVVGPAASLIPGVRQQLPEKFDPVSAFGQPRSEPQDALGRALVPTQQRFVPGAMGGDEPLLQQLRDMGIELPTPRMKTADAREIGRQGRLGELAGEGDIQRAAVEAVLSDPEVSAMPPEVVREAILQVKAELKKALKAQ